jgi:hypothetical protein
MPRWPLILVVPLLFMGACGGSDDEPSSSPTPTTTATVSPTDPTLTGKPAGATLTLTGVVSAGVESGCLILTTTGQAGPWQLTGTIAGISAGDRVTVRGSPAPDLATRCQQGTPFVVEAVEPG